MSEVWYPDGSTSCEAGVARGAFLLGVHPISEVHGDIADLLKLRRGRRFAARRRCRQEWFGEGLIVTIEQPIIALVALSSNTCAVANVPRHMRAG